MAIMVKLLKFMNLSSILSMDSIYKNHKADVGSEVVSQKKIYNTLSRRRGKYETLRWYLRTVRKETEKEIESNIYLGKKVKFLHQISFKIPCVLVY